MYKNQSDIYNKHFYFANKALMNIDFGEETKNYQSLQEAFKRRQKVEIVYTAASTVKTSKRVIHPYAFVVYDESLYCYAFCELKRDFRSFKVVRIKKMFNIGQSYSIPKEFDIRKVFPNIGFIKDPFTVELVISPPHSIKVKETIVGNNQQTTDLDDGRIRFTAEMNGKESVKKWILGMGIHVEVLSPDWLREEIISNLKELLNIYNK